MAGEIHYIPGRGFFTNKTKSALQYTPQQLSFFAKQIAAGQIVFGDRLTICVSVVEQDGYQMLVYTASNQKTSPGIEAAAKRLGIVRWDVEPGVEGRGDVGAPRDAEQIAKLAAEQNSAKLLAVAPSRRACSDCASLLIEEGIKYISPETGKVEVPSVQKVRNSAAKSKFSTADKVPLEKDPLKSTNAQPKFEAQNKSFEEKTPYKTASKNSKIRLNERGTAYKKMPPTTHQGGMSKAFKYGNSAIKYGGPVSTVLGIAYPYIAHAAMYARKDEEGYIPYGPTGYAHESKLMRVARGMMDPSLGNDIPIDSRLNVKTWRAKIANQLRPKKTNDIITFTWQRVEHDPKINATTYEDVDVRYMKLQTGKWIPLLNDPINLPTIPDLNYIINPEVSDENLREYVRTLGEYHT